MTNSQVLPGRPWWVTALKRGAYGLVALLVVAFLLLMVSPWPSVVAVKVFGGDGPQVTTGDSTPAADGVQEQLDLQIGYSDDARIDVFRPEGDDVLPAVVWVHGGGFMSGDKEALRPYLRLLASRGYVTVGVEYSKAPSEQYPTQVEQAANAIAHVVEQADEFGVDPRRIVVAGDSAGAHIAAQTVLAATDRQYAEQTGLPRAASSSVIRGMVLFGGVFDLSLRPDGSLADRWYLRTAWWAYTGERGYAGADDLQWLSLVDHVSSQTPDTFVSTGPHDPLLAHSRAMVEALERAGADTDTWFLDPKETAATIGHEYQFALDTPEALEAFDRVVAFLEEVTR